MEFADDYDIECEAPYTGLDDDNADEEYEFEEENINWLHLLVGIAAGALSITLITCLSVGVIGGRKDTIVVGLGAAALILVMLAVTPCVRNLCAESFITRVTSEFRLSESQRSKAYSLSSDGKL
jgi:hypothetical protein